MGLRRWLLDRLTSTTAPTSAQVDLVSASQVTIKPPSKAGLVFVELAQPWSVSRLVTLFQNAERHPSQDAFNACRIARHRLSCFWMSAPLDQLQALYEGDLGDLQRLQLRGPVVLQDLAKDERQWAERLKGLLASPSEHARQLNILLALMPYTQPGQLKLGDPLADLPAWLITDYVHYCAPHLDEQLHKPAGLLQPGLESVITQSDSEQASSQLELDPLSDRRGEEAMAWFRDDEALDQMGTLIQAYQQDSINQELLEELNGLRAVTAQLWLDVDPVQLQTLFFTPVGEITQRLIRSGFGRHVFDDQDEMARQHLAARADDLAAPEAPGVVLATLMYFPPENISFESTDGLPAWFVEVLEGLSTAD